MSEHLLIERSQGVLTLTLNRADKKNADASLFGVARGMRCPIDETMHDYLILINNGGQAVNYTITVPSAGDEQAFVLTAKPGVGTLKAHETREINLEFVLKFTTKTARWIMVQFEGVDGAYYFPLRIEGEVSTHLDPMELELYGKPLGEGAFGVVYRGRYRGTQVAAKVPRKQGELSASHLQSFRDEIALFEKLRNPFVVNFVGASHVPGKLCICTELLERGTVFDLIHKAKVSLVLKVKMALDASSALSFLHKNGVIYRDLKPDNLLVFSVSHSANVNCKLSDFGSAIMVEDPNAMVKHTGSVGTPVYMAPEIMANAPYNCRVDVYALAMLLWELVNEKAPFSHLKRIWDLPRLVLDGMRPDTSDLDEDLHRIIEQCWLQTPERRPSSEETTASLTALYTSLKKSYDKNKSKQKKASGSGSSTGPRTAHTGQLDQLLEQAAQHSPMPTNDGHDMMKRAADVPGADGKVADLDDLGDHKKDSKKDKKKKKKKKEPTKEPTPEPSPEPSPEQSSEPAASEEEESEHDDDDAAGESDDADEDESETEESTEESK